MVFRKKLILLAKMMNAQGIQKMPLVKDVIDCFEIMISPTEADLLLEIGVNGITYRELITTGGQRFENIEETLARILKKGLALKKSSPQGESLSLAPILPGWFEVILMDGILDDQKRDFIQKLEKISNKTIELNVAPWRQMLSLISRIQNPTSSHYTVLAADNSQFKKSIPIHAPLNIGGNEVLTTGTVNALIHSLSEQIPIAVAHCFCRVWRSELGEPCKFKLPKEACIVVGDLARQVIDYGVGRQINKSDALDIVSACQKKGAIHTSIRIENEKKTSDFSICNCCWDCCGVYSLYNKGALTTLNFKSHFVAKVDRSDLCTHCKICTKFCPTNAITVTDQQISISSKECIGCGQCSTKCPRKVLQLEKQDRNVMIHSQKRSTARIKRSP